MLVLSRKVNQRILLSGNIRITVTCIRGNQVRLGIEAPDQIEILRGELMDSAPAAPSPVRRGRGRPTSSTGVSMLPHAFVGPGRNLS